MIRIPTRSWRGVLTAPSSDKAVEGSIEVMIDLHVPVDLTESQPVDLTN